MDKRSRHQESIIRNYYKNQDALALQKLSEHVSELFLAEGKARQQRWKFIIMALEKLKVPKTRIEHLRKQDDPTLLAKLIEELLAKR
jgi:hypothetical protein